MRKCISPYRKARNVWLKSNPEDREESFEVMVEACETLQQALKTLLGAHNQDQRDIAIEKICELNESGKTMPLKTIVKTA